ncbi:spore germination protein GerPE [Brevibacillus sp. B_LB10_24]|uniref:spore germination protein GerPE n=1 Tax=Brevibacillus sp. B_LB10_24 TaxID=3380645 RepID=UPI0038BD0CCB
MNSRISSVQHVSILNIDPYSIFEVGDSFHVHPITKAIAVQRQQAIFLESEFPLSDYPMFTERIPQPFVVEPLKMETINKSPFLNVDNIKINNMVSSSVLHLGSSRILHSEARVKTIRHLLREKE